MFSSCQTTITISIPCNGEFPNPAVGCNWHEMHHYDDDGRHWCPTGYMYCHEHGGTGLIDGPNACQLWGEFPIKG